MSTTRNILDSLGTVIGTLTLDDSTTEDQWSASLTPYTVSSPTILSSPDLATINISDTSNVTTSSSTASVVGSLSAVPAKGTYLAFFSASINTVGASASGEFGIYVDGTLLSETKRPISCSLTLLGGLVTISVNAIGLGTYTGTTVSLNGAQTIDVRFKSTNGGTIGLTEKVFTLVKVS